MWSFGPLSLPLRPGTPMRRGSQTPTASSRPALLGVVMVIFYIYTNNCFFCYSCFCEMAIIIIANFLLFLLILVNYCNHCFWTRPERPEWFRSVCSSAKESKRTRVARSCWEYPKMCLNSEFAIPMICPVVYISSKGRLGGNN